MKKILRIVSIACLASTTYASQEEYDYSPRIYTHEDYCKVITHYTRKYYKIPIGPGQHPVRSDIEKLIQKYITCQLGDFELQTQEERENSPIIQTIGQYGDYLLFLVNDKKGAGYKIQKFDIYNHRKSDVFSWLNDGTIDGDVAYAAWPERNLIALGLDREKVYVLTKGLESQQGDVVHCKHPLPIEKYDMSVCILDLAFGKDVNFLFCFDNDGGIVKWPLTYSQSGDTETLVIEDPKILLECKENFFMIPERRLIVSQQNGSLYYIHSESTKIACIDQKGHLYNDITSHLRKDFLCDGDYYKGLVMINGKLVTCIIKRHGREHKLITFNLNKNFRRRVKDYKIDKLPKNIYIYPNSFFSTPDQKYLMIDSDENINFFHAGSMKHIQTIKFSDEYYEKSFVFSFFPKGIPALIVVVGLPEFSRKLKKLSFGW